jgi:hypothetical protein
VGRGGEGVGGGGGTMLFLILVDNKKERDSRGCRETREGGVAPADC